MNASWEGVANLIRTLGQGYFAKGKLQNGQVATLEFIAERIVKHGVIVADEVGRGKTRIACAVAEAVARSGGRVAVLVPRGLMHQWRFEYAELAPGRQPMTLTTLHDWVWGEEHEAAVQRRLWLISHGFRYPRVTAKSYDWRVALPSLVHAELHPRLSSDGRTVQGRVAMMARDGGTLSPHLRAMAKRIAGQIAKGSDLHRRLDALPWLGRDGGGLREDFMAGGDSRAMARELLGVWMGSFDLIVIDEAHKSRDRLEDDPGHAATERKKVLPDLLDLLDAPNQRRLSLTATPMEMDAEQWADLVRRTIPGRSVESIRVGAGSFVEALTRVRSAADDVSRLEALEKAARTFQESLSEVVTRRRLMEAEELESVRKAISPFDKEAQHAAHPHRRLQRAAIRLAGNGPFDRHSRSMLIALEGFSRCTRGLSPEVLGDESHGLKTLYTKLAAAAAEIDPSILEDVDRRELSSSVLAHLDRLSFWMTQYRRARADMQRFAAQRGVRGLNPDVAHPRLEATVDEIERWTEASAPQKVLVFGTFKRPMRHLRDVIDVRHCIRSIDGGHPIPFDLASSKLFGVALWQLERMRERKGTLRGVLGGRARISGVRFRSLAREAYTKHRNVLRAVASAVSDLLREESRASGARFPSQLAQVLRAQVLDDWLARRDDGTPRRQFLTSTIRDRLEEFRERVRDPDEVSTEDYGIVADHLERMEALVAQDAADLRTRQTGYCRLMDGDTGWEVRRTIQEGFNRRDGYPHVLIAQSRVGREGLDFHKHCRVLVQFHPEWNPGVVEQQIGRIDRLGSLWRREFDAWLKTRSGRPPRIEVVQVVYEGTYDAEQQKLLHSRMRDFDAALFGSLLPAESWKGVPEDWKKRLIAAAPDFDPRRLRTNAAAEVRQRRAG
jgi:superfamily II DNA or RNA helicase